MLDPQRVPEALASDAYVAIGKATPPIAVTGAAAAGVSLQEWVMIATLAYILLQTAHLVFRWVRELRGDKRGG